MIVTTQCLCFVLYYLLRIFGLTIIHIHFIYLDENLININVLTQILLLLHFSIKFYFM